MSRIPYDIDSSCKGHPLLRGRAPATGEAPVGPRRLFSLGSLWLQDPVIGRRTYKQTRPLWDTLHRQYNEYLTYSSNDIETKAVGETLTRLSEIVGIGCGLATLLLTFSVDVNRITRYQGGGRGRRLDFEWSKKGQRFFHECKGTTYPHRFGIACADIEEQKSDTVNRCKQPQYGPPLTAATGSTTLYKHEKRKDNLTQILIMDPPVGGDLDEEAPAYFELSRVLRYYHGYYEVTHERPENTEVVNLADWLAGIIMTLEKGGDPPRFPPPRLIAQGRVTEPGASALEYAGTLFDLRAESASASEYRTFKEASEALSDPITFWEYQKLLRI